MDDEASPKSLDGPVKVETSAVAVVLGAALLERLWEESGSQSWGLARTDFDRIILAAALRQNFGLGPGLVANVNEQAAFFRGVRLADLTLAAACADGIERAWEHFMATYAAPLTRAAIAISGSETVGRDLADAFYAELYGLKTRDGVRRCPLESYRGRGSLVGWLRTTLSQRFVDHYRRTFREQALDDEAHDLPAAEGSPQLDGAFQAKLRDAVREAFGDQLAEERFLLAAYYLDERTLAEIAKVLNVHEATISRRVKRATESVRKDLLRGLQKRGLSRRAAQEALGADPRDLELGTNLKILLQQSSADSFSGQASSERQTQSVIARATGAQTSEAGGER